MAEEKLGAGKEASRKNMSVIFGKFARTKTMSPTYLLKLRATSAGVTRSMK